jgi:hypothetical protein
VKIRIFEFCSNGQVGTALLIWYIWQIIFTKRNAAIVKNQIQVEGFAAFNNQ